MAEWNEKDHPRDGNGKFTSTGDNLEKLRQEERANNKSIKVQVRENLENINASPMLMSISADPLGKNLDTVIREVREQLARTSGKVKRQGFGEVQVGDRLGKKYIGTNAEKATLATVPAVIAKGIQINERQNHKGREYATYTFAGRVGVLGKESIVAVAVMKTSDNYYKAHRVLTPEGKTLEI